MRLSSVRVECPFCSRVIAATERCTLRWHSTAPRSRIPCNGSGHDVSAEVSQAEQDDRDEWSAWLSK